MGTRNLTVVIHKGEIKMAQYGQWDGYPDGVGRDIAKALDGRSVVDLRKAIEKCIFIDDKQLEQYYKDAGHDGGQFVTMEVSQRVKASHPLLNRDYSGGAAIKFMIEAPISTSSFELRDVRDFAADSLFCEFAYVIDLDKEMVEIYKGFNHTPLTESDRFFFLQEKAQKGRSGEIYYPVKILKSYAMKDFNEQAITDLCEEMAAKAE